MYMCSKMFIKKGHGCYIIDSLEVMVAAGLLKGLSFGMVGQSMFD